MTTPSTTEKDIGSLISKDARPKSRTGVANDVPVTVPLMGEPPANGSAVVDDAEEMNVAVESEIALAVEGMVLKSW